MQQLMTEEIAKTVPRLYEQDGAEDPTVYAHYFSCVNGWDWWLLEFDGTDEAFGLVEGYDDELGYFSIKEMAELNRQMGLPPSSATSTSSRSRLAPSRGGSSMEMDEVGAVGRFGKSPGGAVALTVVVEFESGGEGGAFEVGTAPEGSPELGRLVSDARDEADALVEDGGGWAAVRIGFGDVESIDCESGRTVYVAGEG